MLKKRGRPPSAETATTMHVHVPLEMAAYLEKCAKDNDRTVSAEIRRRLRISIEAEQR